MYRDTNEMLKVEKLVYWEHNDSFKNFYRVMNKKLIIRNFVFLFLLALFSAEVSYSAEMRTLLIKNNKFIPEVIEVPAGVKIIIEVINQDQTAEEFESFSLNREKIVRGGKKIKIFLPPLKAGEYEFFGEFHMDTARGKVVAK